MWSWNWPLFFSVAALALLEELSPSLGSETASLLLWDPGCKVSLWWDLV